MKCRYCGGDVLPTGETHEKDGFCSVDCLSQHQESLDRQSLGRLMESVGSSIAPAHQRSRAAMSPPAKANWAGRSAPGGDTDRAADTGDSLATTELWRFPPAQSAKHPFLQEAARLRFELIPASPDKKWTEAPPETTPERPPSKAIDSTTTVEERSVVDCTTGIQPSDQVRQQEVATHQEEAPIEVAIGNDLEPSIESSWTNVALGGLVAVVIALGLFVGLLLRNEPATSTEQAAVESERQQWRESPLKVEENGQVFLFEPSTAWADYRAQTKVNRYLGLSWVFRVRDESFYVMKLAPGRYRTAMKLTRYAVVGGSRSEPIVADVPVMPSSDIVSVQLETHQSWYRLYLEGQLAAKWQEVRLHDGAFGAVAESLEVLEQNAPTVTAVNEESSEGVETRGNTG